MVFPMLKFKLRGSISMPVPTEKSTFGNACSRMLWYLSVSVLIEWPSFIGAVIVLLTTCWASSADSELPTIFDLDWT